jgi:2'-5' RNA ligase
MTDPRKLAVVAYPELDEEDRARIEAFRRKHDPQAARLGVHFTLVFPIEAVPGNLEAEIMAVARSTPVISFAIRRAEIVPDALGTGSHVFLVPESGATEIAALHDRLYAGVLRPHQRPNIPYIPHMTVAAAADHALAEIRARELDATRDIRGVVSSLDLLDVSGASVTSIASYDLTIR